eukprot:gene20745-27564_t
MEVEHEPVLSIVDTFVDVKGACTEVLTIHATDGPPQFQVLVVPGNPGNASYYKPFIRFLHQEFEGHAEIVSISHPGHDKGPQNTPYGKRDPELTFAASKIKHLGYNGQGPQNTPDVKVV